LELTDEAELEYNEIASVGLLQLADDVKMRQPIDQNNLSMQIILLSIRHFMENGKEEKAQALSAQIKEISNSDIGKMVIEQLKSGS